MTCARANGQLTVAKLVEKPAGVIIVSGVITAASSGPVTVRDVTCLVPANRKKPVLGMPTIIKVKPRSVASSRWPVYRSATG